MCLEPADGVLTTPRIVRRAVVSILNAVVVAIPVVVLGNAIVVTIRTGPLRTLEIAAAITLYPRGRVIGIARAMTHPMPRDPDMPVPSQFPGSRRPTRTGFYQFNVDDGAERDGI